MRSCGPGKAPPRSWPCVRRLKPGPTSPVLGAGGQMPGAGCWSPAPWLLATTWPPGPARAADGLGSTQSVRGQQVRTSIHCACLRAAVLFLPERTGQGRGCRASQTSGAGQPGTLFRPGGSIWKAPGNCSAHSGRWSLLLLGSAWAAGRS